MSTRQKRRKVVGFYLGSPSGGVETFIANLTARLPALGWTPCALVNMAVCPNWATYYHRRGLEVIELPFRHMEDPAGREYIIRAMRKLRANVYVPCYQEIPHSVIPELANDSIGSVMIANASYAEYLAELRPYAQYSQRFVGVSQTICNLLKEMPDVPSDRVRYIPYGVSLAKNYPKRATTSGVPLRLIYAGRMVVENKQVWRYIELAELLSEQRVDFTLTLLGDGSEYPRIREIVRTSPALRKHVRMPGRVTPDRVGRFLLRQDVFVLLSDTEGLPLSLLEAMGRGLVPVASNIASGVAELIQSGRNGYLAPIGDVQAAATIIKRLSRKPALRASLSRRAFATATTDFSIDKMARRYAELFDEAMSAV